MSGTGSMEPGLASIAPGLLEQQTGRRALECSCQRVRSPLNGRPPRSD